MSLRDDLVDLITEELCARARIHLLSEGEQVGLRNMIRPQAETAVSGFQAWLASGELIDLLRDDLVQGGLSNDHALGALYRVLSRIEKEAGG